MGAVITGLGLDGLLLGWLSLLFRRLLRLCRGLLLLMLVGRRLVLLLLLDLLLVLHRMVILLALVTVPLVVLVNKAHTVSA